MAAWPSPERDEHNPFLLASADPRLLEDGDWKQIKKDKVAALARSTSVRCCSNKLCLSTQLFDLTGGSKVFLKALVKQAIAQLRSGEAIQVESKNYQRLPLCPQRLPLQPPLCPQVLARCL